jgi:hypothetical protein
LNNASASLRTLAALLLLMSAGLLCRRADAQTPPAAQATTERSEQAGRLSDEATLDYKAHDYRKAIEKYVAAYALDPDPNLIFNQGRCYEALGDGPAANEKYQEFLRKPGGDVGARKKAQAFVDGFVKEPESSAAPTIPGSRASSTTATSEISDAPSHGPSGTLVTSAWITTGVLATATVISGVFALTAANDLRTARESTFPESRADLDTKRARVATLSVLTDVLGATTLVAGGISLYFTLSRRQEKSVGLGVSGSGIQLRGSF